MPIIRRYYAVIVAVSCGAAANTYLSEFCNYKRASLLSVSIDGGLYCVVQ